MYGYEMVSAQDWIETYYPNADGLTLAALERDLFELRPTHRAMKGITSAQAWVDELSRVLTETAMPNRLGHCTTSALGLAAYLGELLQD